MMLASRLLLAVCLCVALCNHRAQSVFVSIVGNNNGILTVQCRPTPTSSGDQFFITNLRNGDARTVQGDSYTLDIQDDSTISCSREESAELSPSIQFAGMKTTPFRINNSTLLSTLWDWINPMCLALVQ